MHRRTTLWSCVVFRFLVSLVCLISLGFFFVCRGWNACASDTTLAVYFDHMPLYIISISSSMSQFCKNIRIGCSKCSPFQNYAHCARVCVDMYMWIECTIHNAFSMCSNCTIRSLITGNIKITNVHTARTLMHCLHSTTKPTEDIANSKIHWHVSFSARSQATTITTKTKKK